MHKLIDENSLQKNISILGFIPRDDQLQLMRYSQAVIQPSLFEGWSTVIEDSRSLQVPVIASNLKVNKEQLKKTGIYFDPSDPDELASILTKYPERKLNEKIYEDYELRVKKAATKLIEIFKNSDIN